jgi:hypothetical protein
MLSSGSGKRKEGCSNGECGNIGRGMLPFTMSLQKCVFKGLAPAENEEKTRLGS